MVQDLCSVSQPAQPDQTLVNITELSSAQSAGRRIYSILITGDEMSRFLIHALFMEYSPVSQQEVSMYATSSRTSKSGKSGFWMSCEVSKRQLNVQRLQCLVQSAMMCCSASEKSRSHPVFEGDQKNVARGE